MPAFATLILIPLTFSITQGILWGFILHVALHVVAGRARELSRASWRWRPSPSRCSCWNIAMRMVSARGSFASHPTSIHSAHPNLGIL